MTPPRQIIAGTTLMITRRCTQRMFLLKPSKAANALFTYILAAIAARYGILLHACCVLSNHFHVVLTDPHGRLPEFERDLNSLVARSFNALHGRWENFWEPGSYSAVTLVTPADILDKVAYVLANPVAAGLVRTGKEWPGVWSAPARIGSPGLVAARPKHFFRDGGALPTQALLELVCPPGFPSPEAFRAELVTAVKRREDRAARELATQRRAFLGARKVLAQKPFARPKPDEPRRELNPRIACRDKWKRVEALQRLKAFRVAYRDAWEAFARGVRDTVFPHGTYWMRVTYGVSCVAAA